MICNRSVKLCVMRTQMISRKEKVYLEVLHYSDFFDQLCTVQTKKEDESTGRNTDYYLSQAPQVLSLM